MPPSMEYICQEIKISGPQERRYGALSLFKVVLTKHCFVKEIAMQETPQQYIQRMLNHSQGKIHYACSNPPRVGWPR